MMYGTILVFIKFNNFGTRHLNRPRYFFIHSAALPGIYLSPCMYKSPALIRITMVHFYLLKQIACALEGHKHNANQRWIWNITLLCKFVSPQSFMRITAGSLQINAWTKPTLRIRLQTKNSTSTFKYMVHLLSYYQVDSFSTNHRNIRSKKCLHPQRHLQTINVTEVNRACSDQEIK